MVTSAQAKNKYGDPAKELGMILWDVPPTLEIGVIPKRLYCNKDMVKPLTTAFSNLISRGFVQELKTFDGCFNIRKKRGLASMSLHAWGLAIDVNAFVKCFTDAGFDWGGTWQRKDGMHFQLSKI